MCRRLKKDIKTELIIIDKHRLIDSIENKEEAEIIVAKQRSSQIGIVRFRWLGHCTKYVDASHI